MNDWTKIPLDGSVSLIEGFGGEEQFIKKVIENCIFFDPTLIKERFDEVISHLHWIDNSVAENVDGYLNNLRDIQILPVRKSEKNRVYYTLKTTCQNIDTSLAKVIKVEVEPIGKKQDCLVYIDKDGNYAVRDLIKSKTCCVVNRNNVTLRNYIISHIWGQASDPRYFSNLWNLVLVPSYANPLLDKNYDKGDSHSGAKLLNTLKYIITKFYRFNELKWEKLKMSQPLYEAAQVLPIKESIKIHYLKKNLYDQNVCTNKQEIMETEITIM